MAAVPAQSDPVGASCGQDGLAYWAKACLCLTPRPTRQRHFCRQAKSMASPMTEHICWGRDGILRIDEITGQSTAGPAANRIGAASLRPAGAKRLFAAGPTCGGRDDVILATTLLTVIASTRPDLVATARTLLPAGYGPCHRVATTTCGVDLCPKVWSRSHVAGILELLVLKAVWLPVKKTALTGLALPPAYRQSRKW